MFDPTPCSALFILMLESHMVREYALKTGFKVFYIIIGIIAMPIFFLGVPVLMIAFCSYAKTDEDGIEYRGLTTKRIQWSQLAEVSRAPASGLLGALMAPHFLATTDGKKATLPIGTYNDGDELLRIAKSHSAANET